VGREGALNFNPFSLAEEYRQLASEWAELNGKASRLEEMRKSIRAELSNHYRAKAKSMAEAESQAEADPLYKKHIADMVEARTAANIAKASLDGNEWRLKLMQTLEATKRAEMRL
jgi:hypothetical protein